MTSAATKRSKSQMGTEPELKFFDTVLSIPIDFTGECSSTAATGGVALIPQGDTSNTRDGRNAIIKSVQIKGTLDFVPGAAAAPMAGNTWIYMVVDTQANGAYPAITDLFTSANMWENQLNLNNSQRFQVLKKWVHNWSVKAGATTAYAPESQALNWYKKVNIPMVWSSTAGAITEVRTNNIFFAYGSSGSTIDDIVTFSGSCRLRFVG